MANLVPTATKTVEYGKTIETTTVFVSEDKTVAPVQVTTTLNTETQKVTIVDQKTLPKVTKESPIPQIS